jgi:probable F420-dependent oxidoreductase
VNQVKPFRFGHFVSDVSKRKELVELARKVEATGYASLLMGEHVGFALDPTAALMSAAEATSTLRIGSLVYGNDFRNPVMLAKEAATLDLLSDGRLEFGLGSGYLREDYEMTGILFESSGIRISRLEEAVQVIKAFFKGEPFSYQGRFYQVKELTGFPKPLQRPQPPLILGGGAKRTLSLAGREADIVSVNIKTTNEGGFDFNSLSPEATSQKVQWVREAAGDRFDKIEINALHGVVEVTDRPHQAAEEALQDWGMSDQGISAEQLLAFPATLIGTVDHIVEKLRYQREQYGFSYIATWAAVEEFAPVVERLVGK